tara:strand:+ start:992 stop:1978 length:987 start_codon:yes stop_codon:yes gene_type:complete
MTKLYVIAETACSHDGSIKRLKKIIDNVILAGFNAIQIQVWRHQNVVSPNHKDIKVLKKVEISYAMWGHIISYIRKKSKNIDIIACIYDQEAYNFCLKNKIKIFKLHSSDLGNEFLLKKVSNKAKRIDLSIGSSTENEIKNSLKWIKKSCKVWLMYGYQLFPTDPKKVNLNYLKYLKKKYKLRVGYQDHSPYDISGYSIPTTAIGTGVDVIEKHVTDSNKREGTDGQSAIEIKNYKLFIEKIKEAKESLGKEKKKVFNLEEKKYRTYSKKIILFNKNLSKNHTLTFEDLLFLRTGKKGIMIDKYKMLLGKKTIKKVKRYDQIFIKDLK